VNNYGRHLNLDRIKKNQLLLTLSQIHLSYFVQFNFKKIKNSQLLSSSAFDKLKDTSNISSSFRKYKSCLFLLLL